MLVNDIRKEFLYQLEANPNADMLEIIGASFIADEDTIFGTINEEYVKKEIEWYESQSLNVYDMPNPPKIWQGIANDEGFINSNYGWCIYSPYNYSQYDKVVEELKANPKSRRAIMIYNRPSMHLEATKNGMNDFICTNAVHYYISGESLDVVVQMRSNDAVFGFKNDYKWQRYVQRKLAEELGLMIGTMYWQVANLHVYPRHYYLVKGQ